MLGRFVFTIIATIWSAASVAQAQSITDGDTLKLNGIIYRLWGIDAPEGAAKLTFPPLQP